MGEFIQIKDKDGNHVSMNADHVGPSYMPNVFPVSYRMEPLVGQGHADPELYTAKDLVAEPSTLSMMYEMQQAYDSPFMPRPSLMEFDYSTVGASMLDVIQSVKNGATINV
jgi:hypothetical protein